MTQQMQTAFHKGQASILFDLGLSVREISDRLNLPHSTLQWWKKECFRLSRREGSGRPRKTSSRSDRVIVRLAKVDPTLSLTEMAAVVYCSVSKWTVRRRLLEAGVRSRRRPHVNELTERNKAERLKWAMSHCHWRLQWSRVVWTDEAVVQLRGNDRRLRLWVKPDAKTPRHLTLPKSQGGGSLLIWAGIWSDGRTELHIMRGTMNSERYVEVLRQYITPLTASIGDTSSWFLMDDNATCHRSRIVTDYKSQTGIRSLSWPARSPDLNPIENVWSLLKRNVRRSLQPGDGLPQLEELLKTEWAKLNQSTISHLIESLPSRVGKVISRRGEMSGY